MAEGGSDTGSRCRRQGFVLTQAESSFHSKLIVDRSSRNRYSDHPRPTSLSSPDCSSRFDDCRVVKSTSYVRYLKTDQRIYYCLDDAFSSPILRRRRRSSSSLDSSILRGSNNPFDEHFLPLIGRPFVSPAIFDNVVSPEEEILTTWTVEQQAEVCPVNIDVSTAVADETDLEDPSELMYQEKIDAYFEKFHCIVTPSPETKADHELISPCSILFQRLNLTARSTQTQISIPPQDLTPNRAHLLSGAYSLGVHVESLESSGELSGHDTTLDDSSMSQASGNPRRRLFVSSIPLDVDSGHMDEPEKEEECGAEVENKEENLEEKCVTTKNCNNDESFVSFHPSRKANFNSTMLENGPALEVDSGNGSQGISCKSRSLDFKEPSDNADEVLEASSNAQDERNEYFSSVNLEETRAEYFSDSGSDWNDTGSAKNSTPVISREKAVLRYASYMERHVGTQTDFSLAVADVPMEIEEALKEFRLEDTTDTKPKFCGTPIQAWIKKGFVVRSSSPKSFEKRRCYNSHSSSEVLMCPAFVDQTGQASKKINDDDDDENAFLKPSQWQMVSPGYEFSLEAGCERGRVQFDDDSFEREFCTPRKHRASIKPAFEVDEPNLSPIRVEDDDDHASPINHAIEKMDGDSNIQDVNVKWQLDCEKSKRDSEWNKENANARLFLSHAETEASFGIDDTGYQSNQLSSITGQSHSSSSHVMQYPANNVERSFGKELFVTTKSGARKRSQPRGLSLDDSHLVEPKTPQGIVRRVSALGCERSDSFPDYMGVSKRHLVRSSSRHQLKEPCAWRSQPSVLSDDASFVEPNSGGSSIGRISNASSIADVSRVEDVSLHLNISGMMR